MEFCSMATVYYTCTLNYYYGTTMIATYLKKRKQNIYKSKQMFSGLFQKRSKNYKCLIFLNFSFFVLQRVKSKFT